MFYSFVYIFIIAAVIFSLVAIYNIYCGISFIKYKKDVKKDGKNTNTRYNLYAIIHKAIHKKDLTKRLKLYLWVIWINTVRTVGTAIVAALLAIILYQMNVVFNNMGSILTTIFQKDCEACYVKCSNNVENDEKLAYELLFGPDSCNAFITSLNFNDNQLSIYNSLPTIKEKSEYICDYLKEYSYDSAIEQYKKDLETIGTDFRIKVDHIDRKDLEDAELRDDLIALLSDYKVNGKNTRCKCCSNGSDILLKIKCQGHKQWKPGWKFKDPIEDDDSSGDSDDDNSGLGPRHQMGQATGTYAVQLDDGMYYWYHQSTPYCGCTYCGTWTERHWSSNGTGGSKFGSDGCAVYSLAIGISNLMGQEITPDKVFDALGSTYTTTNVKTNQDYFIGVGIKRGEAVKKLSETFGFHYTPVADSVAEWDEILNKGGIIWTSWKDSLCPWCGNGSRHFMCIRKTDGTNYYCFTSCRGKCATSSSKAGAIETMNYPIEKNSCIAMLGNEDGRQAYGLWADPPSGGESGGGGGGSGNTNPSNSGVFEKLAATQGSYNFNGSVTNATTQDGIPLWNGVPSSFNWSTGTDATVWHYQNTAAAWCQNYSSETGQTNIDTYNHFNKEFGRKSTATVGNVQCIEICATAAMINCGFTPSNQAGVNDVGASAIANAKGVIILKSSDGTYYYLPCVTTDAKAHTYPGGIVQTSCARYSNYSQCYSSSDDSCSDYGKGHAALHNSSGHYVYTDRPATVEIEANWETQPVPSGWQIIDVIIQF